MLVFATELGDEEDEGDKRAGSKGEEFSLLLSAPLPLFNAQCPMPNAPYSNPQSPIPLDTLAIVGE